MGYPPLPVNDTKVNSKTHGHDWKAAGSILRSQNFW